MKLLHTTTRNNLGLLLLAMLFGVMPVAAQSHEEGELHVEGDDVVTPATDTAVMAEMADTVPKNLDQHPEVIANTRLSETAATEVAAQAALGVDSRNRIQSLFGSVDSRMRGTTNRLLHITDRLIARANTMAETGIDTSNELVVLNNTHTALTATKQKIQSPAQSAQSVAFAENPRATFPIVRAEYTALKDRIKQSHKELTFVLTALKAMNTPAGAENDTTPEEAQQPVSN